MRKMENRPQYILLHCTAVSYKAMPAQFWAVNNFHKTRDFPKSSLGFYVGYHRLSEGGVEHRARYDWEEGAHCNAVVDNRSINYQSLAYCIAFDGDTERPRKADVVNLLKTVESWQYIYTIPDSKVLLHRHFTPAKTCAGSLIPDDWWKKLKEERALMGQISALEKAISILNLALGELKARAGYLLGSAAPDFDCGCEKG